MDVDNRSKPYCLELLLPLLWIQTFFFVCSHLDDVSEPSSGRDTPASSSSRQGVGDRTEEKGKKDKKKKVKTKKKEKNKGKGKEKEKKKAEEPEETEKKSKKIGFGLLR